MSELVNPAGGESLPQPLSQYKTRDLVGKRFCAWSRRGELQSGILPSRSMYIVIAICSYGICGLALAGVHAILANPNFGGRVVGYSALAIWVGLYIGTLIAVIRKKLKEREIDSDQRPADVPRTAVPVRTNYGLVNGDSAMGKADKGWMWIDRSWLVFRGAKYGFRFQASDFKVRQGPRLFEGYAVLRMPKGISPLKIFITPRHMADGEFAGNWRISKRLEVDLAAWASAAPSSSAALYPPIDFESDLPPLSLIVLRWVPVGLICGSALALFVLLAPKGLVDISIGRLVAPAIMVVLLIPLSAAMSIWMRRTHLANLDKVQKRYAEGD